MITHDIVHDLRAMAANSEQFTKNEVVEMLQEAADAIEADRKVLEKVRAGIMDALGHLEKIPGQRIRQSWNGNGGRQKS
ncbi:hypothetical protein [Pseudaminobacter sp. NGMCC 1.201702]|uniref:hypothetical protein n=1 Tax=Pseudaminobacter sp. NGMCC 1.201702 TaxID=3391825 RepID=UPI0039EE976D